MLACVPIEWNAWQHAAVHGVLEHIGSAAILERACNERDRVWYRAAVIRSEHNASRRDNSMILEGGEKRCLHCHRTASSSDQGSAGSIALEGTSDGIVSR